MESLLSKFNYKEIGYHLANYADLFIKPLNCWRKAIDSGKQGYNFIVLHLIYYTLFILLFNQDLYYAIPLALFEVFYTLIPLIIFLPSFKVSSWLFNKKYSWKSLFRLLLVIKLQAIPICLVFIKLAIWSKEEIFYIYFQNFLGLIFLGLS